MKVFSTSRHFVLLIYSFSLLVVFATFFNSFSVMAVPEKEPQYQYDIVIYGGTSAAVTTAVEAKQRGKQVAIVCPEQHIGGLTSGGLGATDSGNSEAIGGLAREFYHRVWVYYQDETKWIFQEMPRKDGIPTKGALGFDTDRQLAWFFEPHAAEEVFNSWLEEFDIPVFKNEWLDRTHGVTKEGASIVSIQMLSGKIFKAKRFVDASYEGDLMAAAGVSYVIGRESNSQYGETINGIQVRQSLSHQFTGTVDPYVVEGCPESGLLPFVNQDSGGKEGDGDHKIQGYCLRMCLTQIEANRIPIEKPENYDPLQYELLIRSIRAGQGTFTTFAPMPNGKTDSNNNYPVSTDLIGGNYTYPDASYEERAVLYKNHRQWQEGLLWTLQNDERVPQSTREFFQSWGVPRDEFTDNGHWSPQLYVREGRRMVGEVVETERHLRGLDSIENSIGLGTCEMDSHNVQRHVALDRLGRPTVRNEGDVQIDPGNGPYPIDYFTIIPKRNECDNLFVPVCISATHIAFGSIRMEPIYMILGQSCGAAAALSIDQNVIPHEIDLTLLKKQLIEQGQIINKDQAPNLTIYVPSLESRCLNGYVINGPDGELTGEWEFAKTAPSVNNSWIHDKNELKGEKKAIYRFTVDRPGRYECRLGWLARENRATNVPVTVETLLDRNNYTVNQQERGEIANLFTPLGIIEIGEDLKATITVETTNTNGFVLVDAVWLIPLE